MRQREKKNSMAGAVAACRLTSELTLLLLRITVERAACYSWSWAVPAPRRPGYSRLCHGHRCSDPAALSREHLPLRQDGWGGPAAVLGGPGQLLTCRGPGGGGRKRCSAARA